MAGVKISRIFSGCTFFVCYDMSFPFRFSAVKEQSEFGAGNVIKIWMIWINLSATVHARHGLYSRRVIWQTANEIWMHSTPHMYINVLGCAFNIEKNKKQNSSPHFPSIAGMNSVSKLVVYSSTSAQFSSVRSCTRRFGELKKKWQLLLLPLLLNVSENANGLHSTDNLMDFYFSFKLYTETVCRGLSLTTTTVACAIAAMRQADIATPRIPFQNTWVAIKRRCVSVYSNDTVETGPWLSGGRVRAYSVNGKYISLRSALVRPRHAGAHMHKSL